MSLPKSKSFERYLTDEKFKGEIDALFSRVEPYVNDFAKTHSLELVKWYHDLPVWILRWQERSLTRLIHLGAAQSDEMPALAIAVDAYRDVLKQKIRYGLPRAIFVGRIRAHSIEEVPGVVIEFLQGAFEKARTLSEQDLKEAGTFTRP